MGSASQAVLQATQSSKMIQWVKFLWATTTMVALAQSQGAPFDSPVQYHIQTDQGPERFFRFQTTSGQYRKEQRHLDGSVTGTYGWVDPNGVLRLFDYISDAGGYRIEQTRLYKVGSPLNNPIKIPTLGGDPIPLGFEVTPLEPGLNVVDINSPSPVAPLVTDVLVSNFDRSTNPLSKQGQATVFDSPPVIVPIAPPPVIVVPEPEPKIVIGSAGTQLPDPPAPRRTKFVIGAAANGNEVSRPLAKSRTATVGAAASPRNLDVTPSRSRSQTVIGAAANSNGNRGFESRDSRPTAAASDSGRRDFIVIGLRNNRRRRLAEYMAG